MLLHIYVQTNNETGEKNVCLSADPLTPLEDFAVTGGSWGDSQVLQGRALLLGMDDIGEGLIGSLIDVELRSVDAIATKVKD